MISNSTGYLSALNQTGFTENSRKLAATGGNNLPKEEPPEATVQISKEAKSLTLGEPINGGLVSVTGEVGTYTLGRMALGINTMQEWSAKGLLISDDSIAAAGKAFQEAFSKAAEESGTSFAGSRVTLNKHQIMIDSQKVPDWFHREYEDMTSSLKDEEMKRSFESGELFFTSPPPVPRANALASYAAVAKRI
ncbi:MAG: hypothetical protein FH752_10370 [Marinobacter adhaerens]|uniref:Uncharacterized protein n=1 Tax=Marinobacter adhaerens TaxID=1033846 RepID=A0A844HY17_9GAMM|nr:hypothetical protein [Marinobacter adhaerens]